jgi:hypothetical protein
MVISQGSEQAVLFDLETESVTGIEMDHVVAGKKKS